MDDLITIILTIAVIFNALILGVNLGLRKKTEKEKEIEKNKSE